MAKALYALFKSEAQGETIVDGVRAVVINLDSSLSDADIRAAAISQLNAREGRAVFPSGYWDSATPLKISDMGSGPIRNDQDCYVVHSRGVDKVAGP